MLIELVRADGVEILLNPDYIVSAEPYPSQQQFANAKPLTSLKMANGDSHTVKKTVQEIYDLAGHCGTVSAINNVASALSSGVGNFAR